MKKKWKKKFRGKNKNKKLERDKNKRSFFFFLFSSLFLKKKQNKILRKWRRRTPNSSSSSFSSYLLRPHHSPRSQFSSPGTLSVHLYVFVHIPSFSYEYISTFIFSCVHTFWSDHPIIAACLFHFDRRFQFPVNLLISCIFLFKIDVFSSSIKLFS